MPISSDHVRRHFLSWERPWIGQVTAWIASGWNERGPLDLSATLAIVPTQQAGRRLREALAAFASERGAAVFAPRVLTPDALVKQDLGADVASPLESLLAWTEVFRRLDLEAFREVFPVDPPARNFAWALRLAQQFVRLQVTLVEAGLRLSEVAAAAGEEFVELARWQKVAELEALHGDRLAERNLRGPQAAEIEAALNPEFERQFTRIALLAAPDLSPLAQRRLANVASTKPIDVVIFAPDSEASDFDGWGQPIAPAWEARTIEIPEFEERVHLCADPTTQAAQLSELVAKYRSSSDVLALGLADPDVAPLLENELNRLSYPVFNPEGRPMRGERLFVLLSCLAELARDPTFSAVEALARCPDFIASLKSGKCPDFSAARWLKSLDDLRARHLPIDLEAARRFAAKTNRSDELRHGLETMAGLRARLGAQNFAVGAAEASREIFARRQINRDCQADERFEDAANAWTAWLRECAEAEARFDSLALTDWWELALRLYGDQRGGEEKPPGAVELQGWLELLWEDAPHLAVAGMNDGRVPEAVPEDAFLPGTLRQRLGLTTNVTRFARDAYLLQAIAACRASGGRLDLLVGKTAASGDPLRPSRLLLRCADSELPGRIAFLFRAADIGEANAAWTRAWKLRPRKSAAPSRVAVTSLRQYLSCPFRFYLRTVLHMDGVDPLKGELDAFDFGTLCHAALERIGSDSGLRECTDAAVLRAELVRHLDDDVQERYGRLLSLPLIVQVESARQRLTKLAELQTAERNAGWEILHVERPFEIEISGVMVRGKIDRIDRHAGTGEVRVLDYKTSDTPIAPASAHLRHIRPGEPVPIWAQIDVGGRPRAWADLQLPLYLRAIATEFPGRVTGGYFNLPKASGETALVLWEDYDIALHESAMRCAEGACAAISRGEFWPPNENIRPDRDDFAALFHHGVECSVEWTPK